MFNFFFLFLTWIASVYFGVLFCSACSGAKLGQRLATVPIQYYPIRIPITEHNCHFQCHYFKRFYFNVVLPFLSQQHSIKWNSCPDTFNVTAKHLFTPRRQKFVSTCNKAMWNGFQWPTTTLETTCTKFCLCKDNKAHFGGGVINKYKMSLLVTL